MAYESKEETNHNQSSKVLCSSSSGRNDAPNHHHRRQVQSWSPNFIQEQIGWDLHQNVADEENADASFVLGVGHVEISFQAWIASETSCCDVVSVEVILFLS